MLGCCDTLAGNIRALCRCGIRIPSARTNAQLFDKDKCLEPMFGDVGQARTNAAMLLLMIDTTSSRTCTKPAVRRCFILLLLRHLRWEYKIELLAIVYRLLCQ